MSYYCRFKLPEKKYQLIYDVDEVETLLKEMTRGKEFWSVFVSGDSIEYMESYDDVADFSMMGGGLFIAFEDFTLGLIIHGQGLMEYCIYPVITDMDPELLSHDESMTESDVYYDLGGSAGCFGSKFGLPVKAISFVTIDHYAFFLSRYDKKRLDASKRLPNRLILNLEYLDIRFCADAVEYFYIVTKNKDD